MTWRDAIQRACAGVREAEVERDRVLKAAHGAGLSTRQIAKAAGAGPSTVWRWMGGKDAPLRASLDTEATLSDAPSVSTGSVG